MRFLGEFLNATLNETSARVLSLTWNGSKLKEILALFPRLIVGS